jgi:hypothetical protein
MNIAEQWNSLDPHDVLGQLPLDLHHAASGADVAWHLSNVFSAIRTKFETRNRIILPKKIADELLLLSVRAEIAAHEHLPKHYERDIHAGFHALACRILMWAETPEEVAQRPVHQKADAAARARILQNICHNLVLMEDVENRAHERRSTEIDKLRRSTGGAS